MAWSTRQLAELAGTTVKAVRHYHRIGLLEEPERASNGYKRYGVAHLVRLVQIKRLGELGVPLAQIAAMERADEEPDEAIRVLDAELEATIGRLTRIRAELAVILRHRAPLGVPPGFETIARDFSTTQRALLTAYSTVFSEEDMAEFREMVAAREETDDEFDRLPSEAGDAVIERLAERLAPVVRRSREEHPRFADTSGYSPQTISTMAHAVAELSNPAQIRVLHRVNELLAGETG
ncbi:MerR family transcriptional regulator [Sciscionella sediminilitoris]|uniref:helix-turn-helix domain-containing protein n=1 Tax=Sciscionella sediminilitoris TaxID=1445613 RepID=UPI0004DFC400|nr:MerR family transcriptional regulator [Sciscionella sp. SE31]